MKIVGIIFREMDGWMDGWMHLFIFKVLILITVNIQCVFRRD